MKKLQDYKDNFLPRIVVIQDDLRILISLMAHWQDWPQTPSAPLLREALGTITQAQSLMRNYVRELEEQMGADAKPHTEPVIPPDNRFGPKIIRNRDKYTDLQESRDAWARWSQQHQEYIVMYTDWLELEYKDETDENTAKTATDENATDKK